MLDEFVRIFTNGMVAHRYKNKISPRYDPYDIKYKTKPPGIWKFSVFYYFYLPANKIDRRYRRHILYREIAMEQVMKDYNRCYNNDKT